MCMYFSLCFLCFMFFVNVGRCVDVGLRKTGV